MGLVLNENLHYKDRRIFYSARIARIYSSYFIYLFFSVIVILPILLTRDWKSLSFSSFLVVIFANLFIFGSDAIMFLQSTSNRLGIEFTPNFRESFPQLHSFLVIPQAWSLPLELTFYLLIPLIYKNRKIIYLLFTLSIVSRVVTITYFGNIDPWNYRFFPNALFIFLTGTLLFDLYKYISRNSLFSRIDSIKRATVI